jgi:hypothetical protein
LHRDLETEVFGGLIADRLDHQVGHADVAQFDILDLLRPDRRKAAKRLGADRRTGRSRPGFQDRSP